MQCAELLFFFHPQLQQAAQTMDHRRAVRSPSGRWGICCAARSLETISAVQTVHQQKDQWEHNFPGDGHDREEEHRDRFEVEDVLRASVTRPSAAAVISMGVTALLCGLLALAFWLLVAAWLYQAAVLSSMSGPLWAVLGLCGNVFAAALFAIVRSFLRYDWLYLAVGPDV